MKATRREEVRVRVKKIGFYNNIRTPPESEDAIDIIRKHKEEDEKYYLSLLLPVKRFYELICECAEKSKDDPQGLASLTDCLLKILPILQMSQNRRLLSKAEDNDKEQRIH